MNLPVPTSGQSPNIPARLPKSRKGEIAKYREARSARLVPHWRPEDVKALAKAAGALARGDKKKERDELLVLTIWDACLRVSEALGLTPSDVERHGDAFLLNINISKTGWRTAALSPTIGYRLKAYCAEEVKAGEPIFPLTRRRVHQIVTAAAEAIGLPKPEGVGLVHCLRHSGALARLAASGNPRSVQHQLGHSSPDMTARYLKTLQAAEGVAIQAGIDLMAR